MSSIAIQVENLSKRYRIGMRDERSESLIGAVSNIMTRPIKNFRHLRGLAAFGKNEHHQEDIIWALRDVSFAVKQGECVGIIGRNGSGKSTLLKVLARITEPTNGRATLNGRSGSLLEVGTGFHQELTGRENIYLNGTILGMSKKEIRSKFDEIVSFSGVEKFIDTPVKRYSTGMRVRLAFAVAAHLEPEILIVDEVLAVGDAEFQRKCLEKMDDVATQGRTVLFVSHNMTAIQALCDRVIVLEKGTIVYDNAPKSAVEHYQSLISNNLGNGEYIGEPGGQSIFPAQIVAARLTSNGVFNAVGYPIGSPMEFTLECNATDYVPGFHLGIGIIDASGQPVVQLHNHHDNRHKKWEIMPGPFTLCCEIKDLALMPGKYYIDLDWRPYFGDFQKINPAFEFNILECDYYNNGSKLYPCVVLCPEMWSLAQPASNGHNFSFTRVN